MPFFGAVSFPSDKVWPFSFAILKYWHNVYLCVLFTYSSLKGLFPTVFKNYMLVLFQIRAELMIFGVPIKEVRLMKNKATGKSNDSVIILEIDVLHCQKTYFLCVPQVLQNASLEVVEIERGLHDLLISLGFFPEEKLSRLFYIQ